MSQRIFPVVVIAALMIAALSVNVLAQEGEEPVRTGLRPDSPPYGIRGPYPVGTMEFVIEDEERPLPVTVWYPAVNPEEVPETITYSINYPPVFSDLPYQGQAILNAAADTERGPYPLAVFMHGVFRFRLSSTYFTEHLASHGFVVMAADHTGYTVAEFGRAGYEVPSFIDFPLDAQRQIAYAEHLTGPDGPLVGLIDMERIAVSGHSLGGYGAVAAAGAQLDFDALSNFCEESQQPDYTCDFGAHRDAPKSMMAEMLNLEEVPEGAWPAISDPRVDALVAMSPARIPAFGSEGLAVADASALILIGSGDTVEPGDSYARRAYEHWGGLEKAIVTFEHGDHMLFGDDCARMSWILDFGLFVACSDPIWDMDRAHDLINHFATAFLLAELYGDEDAATALAPEAVVFPGITYEATGY